MAFEQSSDQVWLIILKGALWLLCGKQIAGGQGKKQRNSCHNPDENWTVGVVAEVLRRDQ